MCDTFTETYFFLSSRGGRIMRIEAFILVFISVFMHAAWNFMSKKDSPSSAFYLLAAAAGGVVWTGALFFCQVDITALPWKFWMFFLISNCFEVLYFLALSNGYKKGDISLVYPLGRALPVILIAFGISTKMEIAHFFLHCNRHVLPTTILQRDEAG